MLFLSYYSSMIVWSKTDFKENKQFLQINVSMSTIFMNSESSKTSDAHRLGLNITNKMDLWRGDKRGS